jgi:hypothetical protein
MLSFNWKRVVGCALIGASIAGCSSSDSTSDGTSDSGTPAVNPDASLSDTSEANTADGKSDVLQTGDGSNPALTGPGFPGAGNAGAGDPISTGSSAESCGPQQPTDGAAAVTVVGPEWADCYYINSDHGTPAAIVERVIEVVQGVELIHIRLTLNPAFVDNTYGVNAVGWDGTVTDAGKPGKSGHKFGDLVGSDKAEFVLTDANGNVIFDFFLDYISVDASSPSGYGSLCVSGGDGKMVVGDAAAIVACTSSLDRDMNACGYGSYTVDSPATDKNYTPNPDAPNWDYRVVYDVWIKKSAFDPAGFGQATISYVHASPSKVGDNTLPVALGACASDSRMTGGCKQDGQSCTSASDCCLGFCTDGVCKRPPCQATGGACTQSADCCSDLDTCQSGTCQTFQIK